MKRTLRLLARGLVAVSVALLAGAFAASFGGLWAGLAVGLAVLGLMDLFLRWLRTRPRVRRRLLTLLLIWVAASTGMGLNRAARPDPGRTDTRASAPMLTAEPIRVGIAASAFRLPAGTTLAGWGMEPRRRRLPAFGGFGLVGRAALDVMGPIFVEPTHEGGAVGAKALVLRRPGSAPPIGFLRLDLIYVDPALVSDIRERVADLGFDRADLVIAATHTHSGPGGTMTARAAQALGTDHYDPAVVRAIVDGADGALRKAYETARPGTIEALEARDRGDDGLPALVQTRGAHADRDRAGDRERIDDRVLVLLFREPGRDVPFAALVQYAVQPVMLRPRHLELGSDIVGALETELSATLPGHPDVLFLNGHCGDVTPKRGGRSGREGATEVARAFAARLAPQLEGSGAVHETIRIGAATAARSLAPKLAFASAGSRRVFEDRVLGGPFGDDVGGALASVVCLPVNAWIWSLGFHEVRVGVGIDGGVVAAGVAVRLDSPYRTRPRVGALILDDADGARIASFLWHGGVGTQALLKQWRARAEARGLPPPFVVGMAGDALGYLVTEEEFEAGRYEALSSLHGRHGSRLVGEMLFDALTTAAR